jgi:hypothetical protein
VGAAAFVAVSVLSTPAGPPAALEPPRFVEESAAAGLDHAYDGDWPFFVGGGVAALDCNADGRAELFFAGGENPAALYRNDSTLAGALRFTALPDPVTDLAGVTGAYPLDIDGDGTVDLAVLRSGENVVLRGLGDCRFERANEAWGIDGGDELTVAFSATWEGAAALPTLAFGNYVDVEARGEGATACSDSSLLRPAEAAVGYSPPITLAPGYCTLSILFSDWDRSGRRDLRMTNDRHYYRDGEEQLWRIAAGEEPRPYTRDEGWALMQIWGMGIASQDLTGDGMPEVFLTSQGDNKLQTLADDTSGPAYRDIAIRRGVTAHRPFAGGDVLPSTAWHAEFQDVNNDTFIDLFVAKGNVEAMPDFAARDPSNLLIGQPDGTFVEGAEAAGVLSFARARGAALVDLNLDGLLDLVVVNRREPASVWRNVGGGSADEPAAMGHWVALRVVQPAPNVDAIGAWLQVRVGDRLLERELTVGGGHAGGQLGWVHVGLGSAETAEVRVIWPDGEEGPWLPLAPDQFVTVERGSTEARPWLPPADR